jgi:diacylglycerol kinase family enzyme
VRAVAIVNGNARRLRERLRGRLVRALPGAVVFTHSLAQARAAIRAEVARGADLIVLGGGDGTVVMGLALIAEACRGEGRPEPAIGVLRLGAANAIADAVGASGDAARDLARLARGDGAWRTLRMLNALGVRAPFVGVGVDAQLIEDRAAVSRIVDRIPGARRLVGEAARAALSIGRRSVLRLASPSRVRVAISNLGAPAIAVRGGRPTGNEIPAGGLLWEGACTLVAGSTTPYFGFGLKPFGLAGARGDRFHLRCGEAGLLDLLPGAPAAALGGAVLEGLHDFLCDRVEIRLEADAPIQAGGELLGHHRRLEIALGAPVIVAALGATDEESAIAEPE